MTEADQPYRFVVKCDRTFNAEIEKLARACNVSPTTLVQRHFEALFERPQPTVRPTEEAPSRGRADDLELCQSVGITLAMLALHRVMASAADPSGQVQMSHLEMSVAAGIAKNSVPAFLKRLEGKRLVRCIGKPSRNRPAIWHVYSIEGRGE